MARITHPNVIAVYDSGVLERPSGPEVYLVMELVDGVDLRSWLAELRASNTSSKEKVARILACFIAAGQGLSAAHAEGLVHRDFKPANVQIAHDGRVLVGDFGLVRTASTEPVLDEDDEEGSGDLMLTRSGERLGTPAYMSPEQHRGEAAGAASDQFSYALALFEALYGVPAFSGMTTRERSKAVLEGQLAPWPKTPSVPRPVVDTLRRALAPVPAHRFPSMDALLEALAPRRKRALGVGMALAVAAVAAGGAFFLGRLDPPEQCSGASERLVGVWDDSRRASLIEGWSTAPPPFGPQTRDEVLARLDAYAERWTLAQRSACEDQVHRGPEPESIRRMACLELRRLELDAVVDELVRPGPGLFRRALETLQSLSPVPSCGEIPSMAAALVLTPEEQRARVEQARARARLAGGRLALAEETLDMLEPLIRSLGQPRLGLSQALLRARLDRLRSNFEGAETRLRDALHEGVRLRAHREAAEASLALAQVTGLERGFHREGLGFVDLATALAARPDGPRPKTLEVRAALLAALGRRDEAVQTASVALSRINDNALERGVIRTTLGEVLVDARAYSQAEPVLREGIRDIEAALGLSHPRLVRPLTLLARARLADGDLDVAERLAERALELATDTYGTDHPERAKVLLRYAPIRARRGRLKEAREHNREALRILRGAYGPSHTIVARAHVNLGAAHHRLGELREAERHYRTAVDLREATLGPTHPDLVIPLQNLGGVLIEQQRPSAAIAPLQRAWHIRSSSFSPPVALADVTFWLGRALWASGRDKSRGQRLMKSALTTMEKRAAPARFFIQDYLRSQGLL